MWTLISQNSRSHSRSWSSPKPKTWLAKGQQKLLKCTHLPLLSCDQHAGIVSPFRWLHKRTLALGFTTDAHLVTRERSCQTLLSPQVPPLKAPRSILEQVSWQSSWRPLDRRAEQDTSKAGTLQALSCQSCSFCCKHHWFANSVTGPFCLYTHPSRLSRLYLFISTYPE